MNGIKFKPIAYLGIVMILIGMPGLNLIGIHDTLIQTIGAIISIVGFYFVLKGREKLTK